MIKNKNALTDAEIERICHSIAGRLCAPFNSPYIKGEVLDAAFVSAHIAREEKVSRPLFWVTVKRSAMNELRGLLGHSSAGGARAEKSGYKLPLLLTEGLTLAGELGDYDNPKLLPGACDYERSDAADLIEYLLSRLDETRRGILTARYADGLSDVEIGKLHGVSGPTIKRSIERSLERLRAVPEAQDLLSR